MRGSDESFDDWCQKEFGFGKVRVFEYIAVAREFGELQSTVFLGPNGPGHSAIARLAQMKDKELQSALVTYTQERTEQGEKVTQKEVLHVMAELKAAKARRLPGSSEALQRQLLALHERMARI